MRLRPVESRAEAERLVRDKQAGTALVIPGGTEAALDAGRPASLVLYTDPVKYLERLNVRLRLLELRDALAAAARRDDAGGCRRRARSAGAPARSPARRGGRRDAAG